MRILNYMKVDLRKCMDYRWVLLFPLIALFLLTQADFGKSTFAMVYCLFGGVVIATIPFNKEKKEENGFIRMLPGKPGDSTRGHFLFAFCVVLFFALMGRLMLLFASMVRTDLLPEFQTNLCLYPALSGVALLINLLEDILCVFLGNENTVIIRLLRMAPAFVFLFGVSAFQEKLPVLFAKVLGMSMGISWLFLLLSAVIFIVLAELSARIVACRD